MKMKLYLFAVLFLLPWGNACTAQTADSVVNALTRCWRALSHEYSPIYGLEEEEIKHYSKQRICFARDSISMYLGVFYSPKYSIKRVNADKYAQDNFDCSKQKLNINADSVFQITISSVTKPLNGGTTHKMTDVIAFDGECIYVAMDGVIFKLYDADRKVEGRSSN